MFDQKKLQELARQEARWKEQHKDLPERQALFATLSNQPVERVYTPLQMAGSHHANGLTEAVEMPGEYPYTRGVHATGYRGRLWTIRLFSGFGNAEETNARYKYLMKQGQAGLSVAFDLPTLYGYDADNPACLGEFGKCGVGVSSLADMEVLFDGIPLDQITTSMTINSPAAVIWAMYLVAAEKQGAKIGDLGGTLQNDILKEYIAQNEYIFPPQPSMRLVVDTIEFASKYMPKWNPVSISGYHIREAGSTAAQELAFTLADGVEYVRATLERGLDIDDFAPRLSFFFNCHNYFFEEIAKFRAARRIWAKQMREVFKAKKERSWWLRFHTQTAGCALTAQQPENNIMRVALQALAAVLGGTQSLHTNALDEALSLPTERAALLALRTQQIIAHETGVTDTVDPLGGSYFIETLTNQMEEEANKYFQRIAALGGIIPAIEQGFLVREIAEASFRYQQEIEKRERVIVSVNEYVEEKPLDVPLLKIDPESERRHLERLKEVRRRRDGRAVAQSLKALEQAARGRENLMPSLIEAVRNYATLGEVCDTLREVFGVYDASAILG